MLDETGADVELLAAVARGETAALRALHRRHAPAAVRFAWRMLGSAADAEEAAAEALVELWRQAHRFRGEANVRTWLLGIVRHKALDILRRRDVQPCAEGEQLKVEMEDDPPDPSPGPEERLSWRQALQRIEHCLGELAREQREAIYLAVVEGLSVEEIAYIQGVPPGTVATRVYHARRKLRHCAGELE